MDQIKFHEMTVSFLRGTRMYNDGGTIFGPVPKAVWAKKFPVNENNQIPSQTNPMLIQYHDLNILIDTAIDPDKFDKKGARNQGILGETSLFSESMAALNLTNEDIDIILMSHMHSDHANGLTRLEGDNNYVSAFPNATIYMSEIEWNEVRNPNMRTRSTYRKENWEAITEQVKTFTEYIQILPGIEMFHTGGHSNGHSIIKLTQNEESMVYMADLVLTHVHFHPLYVGGVDDYPMDSIKAKNFWLPQLYQENTKFIFFHDPYYCMLQFDQEGKEIIDSMERTENPLVPWDENEK
ncbi:MBL fold metallo-hydrolase [Aerococcaceae bacterium DSM 111020]|nr:MBL fold metallo-hydrolase [Aerococcaceae bacterium DSM 111020]